MAGKGSLCYAVELNMGAVGVTGTLAANRPPKAIELAQEMIDNARAVSTDEAVQVGLVDFKANDLPHLLKQLDGRQGGVLFRSGVTNLPDARRGFAAAPQTALPLLMGAPG